MNLQILPTTLLQQYIQGVPESITEQLATLQDGELSTPDFSFYTSVASVFSSKIEGEAIELDSYIKHKRLGIPFLPDYTKKTDDLYEAYLWAQSNTCSLENINKVHTIISRHLLETPLQGAYRTGLMYVTTPQGKIEYVAAAPAIVGAEMAKFGADLHTLLEAPLTTAEAFFFAALLHLVLVKIHPYADGNGRTARLLEKWFLAQKLGPQAWLLTTERHYYQHHGLYYQNLRLLGLEYDTLDYGQMLPFLRMGVGGIN